MDIIRILFVISILSYTAANLSVNDTCPKYLSDLSFNNYTCYQKRKSTENSIEDFTFYYKKCDPRYVCNLGLTNGTCNKTYLEPNKFPGEYCTKADLCHYGKCVNNHCEGNDKGRGCNNSAQCNPGLYCKDGTCREAAKPKEDCSKEIPCVAKAVCTNTTELGEMKLKCVTQGYFGIGNISTIDLACKTFFTIDDVCVEGYKLYLNGTKRSPPHKCPENNICIYKNSKNLTLKKFCECGKGESGDKMCYSGEGDITMDNYIKYVNSLKDNDCHILRGPLCKTKPIEEMGEKYYRAYIEYANMTRQEEYYNNTYHLKYISNYDYWYSMMHIDFIDPDEGKKMPYMFFIITLGIIGFGDILLVVLYFCKLKSDAEKIDKID